MKSPVIVEVGAAESSRWVPVDYRQTPFNIGMGVKLSSGAVLNYTVQHTFDNIQDPTVTPVAFDNSGLTGLAVNDDGNYAFPVKAIRLTVNSWASGTATLLIVQGES